MISFRYHIVSIIAVFLALALGIVIGTTALNGPITTDLRHQVDGLKGDRTSLAKQVKTLTNRVDDANQFASTYGQQLIAGRMQKTETVLVIGMPNSDSSVQDKVARDLSAAGATVTGRLELTDEYIDQGRGTEIAVTGHQRHASVRADPAHHQRPGPARGCVARLRAARAGGVHRHHHRAGRLHPAAHDHAGDRRRSPQRPSWWSAAERWRPTVTPPAPSWDW